MSEDQGQSKKRQEEQAEMIKSKWIKAISSGCVFFAIVLAVLGVNGQTVAAEEEVEINATNFPDNDFRTYVSMNFDTDSNGKLSQTERDAVTAINVRFLIDRDNWDIKSMQGIEFFANLTDLDCCGQSLSSLDVSQNTALIHLDCSANDLTSLDVSQNKALTTLDCGVNQLTSLNVHGCTALETLICDENDWRGGQLTTLDVSGCTALKKLQCNNNQMVSLNASGCTALTDLDCGRNQLTSLDISGCTALIRLSCFRNFLTSLDVSGFTKLQELYCADNLISDLNVSGCVALTKLDCYTNALSDLDVSDCTALTYLDCSFCAYLTSIDLSKNTALTNLHCSNDPIMTITINTVQFDLSLFDEEMSRHGTSLSNIRGGSVSENGILTIGEGGKALVDAVYDDGEMLCTYAFVVAGSQQEITPTDPSTPVPPTNGWQLNADNT